MGEREERGGTRTLPTDTRVSVITVDGVRSAQWAGERTEKYQSNTHAPKELIVERKLFFSCFSYHLGPIYIDSQILIDSATLSVKSESPLLLPSDPLENIFRKHLQKTRKRQENLKEEIKF